MLHREGGGYILGHAASRPFLPGDTVAPAPLGHCPHWAGSEPSIPTSRLAASARRAPCQSHSSSFLTDYPRRRHPRERQLSHPDVGTLARRRNQGCSRTCLAQVASWVRHWVGGWGMDRGSQGRGSEDPGGPASFPPPALNGSSRGPAPERLRSKTQIWV